jgi:hypothetical protein
MAAKQRGITRPRIVGGVCNRLCSAFSYAQGCVGLLDVIAIQGLTYVGASRCGLLVD